MSKQKTISLLWLSFLSLNLTGQSTAISFRSTEGNYWLLQPEQIGTSSRQPQVFISTASPQQTFKGWGTCFNELDYEAWLLLPEVQRTLFLKRAFNPDGDLRLTVGRIPVGASDYACDWYSCDETPDQTEDFNMDYFSIRRDQERIIPSIKLAQGEQPRMTFWASPWSPPQWMKKNKHYAQAVTDTNGNTEAFPPMQRDQFVEDDRYYRAYCLYFDRFISAYAEQGIPITALAYQNEAYSYTPYPGCAWLPATTGRFLANYLGPYMAEHHPDVTLIAGTLNTADWNVYTGILNTPGLERYVGQVGLQWEGAQQIAAVRRTWPQYELVQTESECGNGTFDWAAAVHTFELCCRYLTHGVTTYTYWNAILQDGGFSTWGWRQNALVQVSSSAHTAFYTPEYYAYKHFTHLIVPGSRILACDVTQQLVSAVTPDGNVVVVIGNDAGSDKTLTVDIDGQRMDCQLPARSFSTFVVGPQQALADILRSEARGLATIEWEALTEGQRQGLAAAATDGDFDRLVHAVAAVRGMPSRSPFEYAAVQSCPVDDGTYFIYDVTSGLFLGQVTGGTQANMPRLTAAPERIVLKKTTKGCTVRFENRPADGAYLKLGVFDRQYVWTDGKTYSTYWTFMPNDDGTYTLAAEDGHYTLESGETLSGTWYLAGTNVSASPAEAHRYALIAPEDYICQTGDATPALLNATVTEGVTTGWLREKNSASGYAEQQAAISSAIYGGYGISHWAPSPQTDARIIYQECQGLPAGEYTLSACAAATLWNDNQGGDNREGISIFLSDGTEVAATPITTARYAPYAVSLVIDEEQPLQLGLRASSGNVNTWAFLANVCLSYKASEQPVAVGVQDPCNPLPRGGVHHKNDAHECYDIGGRPMRQNGDRGVFIKRGRLVTKKIERLKLMQANNNKR